MEERSLGTGGLMVSPPGFGCMGLTEANGDVMPEAYGPFATKVGFGFGLATGTRRAGTNSHPDPVCRACDAAVKRLGTGHIDLFCQHRGGPGVAMTGMAGAVRDLIFQSKVRHFDLSEAGLATIHRAPAVRPRSAVQREYALWMRAPEAELLPVLAEPGIGFAPFGPLGAGVLSGKVGPATTLATNDFRSMSQRFAPGVRKANLLLVGLIQGFATMPKLPRMQLAWLLAKAAWIVPIPDSNRLDRLTENPGAAQIAPSPATVKEMGHASAATPIGGLRLPAPVLAMTGL